MFNFFKTKELKHKNQYSVAKFSYVFLVVGKDCTTVSEKLIVTHGARLEATLMGSDLSRKTFFYEFIPENQDFEHHIVVKIKNHQTAISSPLPFAQKEGLIYTWSNAKGYEMIELIYPITQMTANLLCVNEEMVEKVKTEHISKIASFFEYK